MTLEALVREIAREEAGGAAQTVRLDDDQLEALAEKVAGRLYVVHLHHLPDRALLSSTDGQRLLGVSKSTWSRRRAEGVLPPALVTAAGERWRKGDLLREVSYP